MFTVCCGRSIWLHLSSNMPPFYSLPTILKITYTRLEHIQTVQSWQEMLLTLLRNGWIPKDFFHII